MDMNDRVEFVALTKEEVETMIAKAALAGASVAADTLQKAHQKEQKYDICICEQLMEHRCIFFCHRAAAPCRASVFSNIEPGACAPPNLRKHHSIYFRIYILLILFLLFKDL